CRTTAGKPAVALPARRLPAEPRGQPAKVGLPTVARRDDPGGERRLVAREGLEPSKPQGRQIYSLLRLTASLPRQLCVIWNALRSARTMRRLEPFDGAGEGIPTPDLLITNRLLYRTELREPDNNWTIAPLVPPVQQPA